MGFCVFLLPGMLCWKFDVKWAMGGPLSGVCICGELRCLKLKRDVILQRAGEVRISQRLWAGTCLSETQWRLQTMDLIPSPSPSVCLLSFSPVPLRADRRCAHAQCLRIRPICCPWRPVWEGLTGVWRGRPSPRPLLLDTFIWPAQTAFFSPSACLTVTLHYSSNTCMHTSVWVQNEFPFLSCKHPPVYFSWCQGFAPVRTGISVVNRIQNCNLKFNARK